MLPCTVPLFLWLFLPVQVLAITDLPSQNVLFAQMVQPGTMFKTVYSKTKSVVACHGETSEVFRRA